MELARLLNAVIETGSPDLHLRAGLPPVRRLKNGSLEFMAGEPNLTEEDVKTAMETVTHPNRKENADDEKELDFSYEYKGIGRFRVNVYHEKNGLALAFRVISGRIPTLQELGLGNAVEHLTEIPNGLVLVTGPTGSGKSTTLASLVDHINETRGGHIITIEDPIEYVYEQKKALITQREVGAHTQDFKSAIRSALRQDPNVVLVGEMRDLETMAATLTLAETGHLVFSTLHTTDAAQTVDRIIDVFPAYQQQQIRAQLSGVLKGVISQRLIPKADGEGRVAAREVLIVNDAARHCIAQGETYQIYSILQLNGAMGMVSMDESLIALAQNGLITPAEAISKATDPQNVLSRLNEITRT